MHRQPARPHRPARDAARRAERGFRPSRPRPGRGRCGQRAVPLAELPLVHIVDMRKHKLEDGLAPPVVEALHNAKVETVSAGVHLHDSAL